MGVFGATEHGIRIWEERRNYDTESLDEQVFKHTSQSRVHRHRGTQEDEVTADFGSLAAFGGRARRRCQSKDPPRGDPLEHDLTFGLVGSG